MKFIDAEVVNSEIIFKKILPQDFPFYSASYHQITPSALGFISEQIKEALNFEESNTVVINAGVGQGKTHSILEIAKRYLNDGFVVVFAVPYNSLIDQYKKELQEREISKDSILDFRDIGSKLEIDAEEEGINLILPIDGAKKDIHILTVNAILGNPGEDAIKQAQKKIDYINCIIERCRKEQKKVIWIFDEIHDSIQNFKPRLVYNLWKWKDVLFKTFCISATYNEASKVVIKYLAEITDSQIQIIESQRIKIEAKQSDLFLLLYNKQHYRADDPDFIKVFQDLLDRGKRINILSFSKTLATEIAKPKGEIGKLLTDKFGEVNLCTSTSNNVFDATKCNIGTNFSTGINIKGNDSAFVIILPSALSYNQGRLGVFSNGINTLIQALARIRDKSEIYIITPKPEFLISYQSNYEKNVRLIEGFDDIKSKEVYYDINVQRKLIEYTYNQIKSNINDELIHIDRIKAKRIEEDKPTLYFPNLEDYILSDGEKVLAKKYEIFGKDFSIYTFWAAFNDQFINCRLKGIISLNEITLRENLLMSDLKDFTYSQLYEFLPGYDAMSSINNLFEFKSDLECYNVLKETIFKNKVYYINSLGEKVIAQKNKMGKLERGILGFIQVQKKNSDYYGHYFFNNFIRIGSSSGFQEMSPTGNEYTLKDYLFACFKNAVRDTSEIERITENQNEIKEAYKVLYQFFLDFKTQFVQIDINGKEFIVNDVVDFFQENQLQNIVEAILVLRSNDELLKRKEIFSFFQPSNFKISNSEEKKAQQIVQFYKNTFFHCNNEGRVQTATISSPQNKRAIILEEYKMPEGNLLNLLFIPNDAWWEDISIQQHKGTVLEIKNSLGHPDPQY